MTDNRQRRSPDNRQPITDNGEAPDNRYFFFTGGFAAFAGVFAFCGLVSTPPSSSERPSSTSTVWVTASPPFVEGWPAAGAIVCVVGAVVVADGPFPRQPGARSASDIRIRSDSLAVFLTDTSSTELIKPDSRHLAISLTGFAYNAPPMDARKRIGVFGWGVVAPKSPDIDTFERNLERPDSWLTPFRGFGPSNFLVGYPQFDFETYRDWFDQRVPPANFGQLKDKMGPMVQSCIGAFIQSLTQNPGIKAYLQSLGMQAHVFIGTGIAHMPGT